MANKIMYEWLSMSERWREFDMSISSMSHMCRKRWWLEKTVKYLISLEEERTNKRVYQFKDVDQRAQELGINVKCLKHRVWRYKVSLEEAINYYRNDMKHTSNSKRLMVEIDIWWWEAEVHYFKSLSRAARKLWLPQPAVISTAIKRSKWIYKGVYKFTYL